ncbi:hypothetical protein [Rubrivirga sp. IMCC45206]|uniref:hypothetical protein n=1 Tax=Rubrivirga sp. IMCC45206 TaxID=3391614 RepID=UPI0039902B5A
MRLLLVALVALITLSACADAPSSGAPDDSEPTASADAERAAILAVLNGETRAALSRDYDGWREHWVHEPYVVKTYLDLTDGTGSEMRGFAAVNDFVRDYLDAHPEPEPPPPALETADIRLYGNGAAVTYEQQDADQGWKRESRLMEKVGGDWRIAGMHTTIYGPERPD